MSEPSPSSHPDASPCEDDEDHVFGPWTKLLQEGENMVQFQRCVRCQYVQFWGIKGDAEEAQAAIDRAFALHAAERAFRE